MIFEIEHDDFVGADNSKTDNVIAKTIMRNLHHNFYVCVFKRTLTVVHWPTDVQKDYVLPEVKQVIGTIFEIDMDEFIAEHLTNREKQ